MAEVKKFAPVVVVKDSKKFTLNNQVQVDAFEQAGYKVKVEKEAEKGK